MIAAQDAMRSPLMEVQPSSAVQRATGALLPALRLEQSERSGPGTGCGMGIGTTAGAASQCASEVVALQFQRIHEQVTFQVGKPLSACTRVS